MNIPDNSKFEKMVKNRPPLSILPTVNKRIVSQYLARNIYFQTAFALTGAIFIYKFFVNANSAPFVKSRLSFAFESDPYTGKVSCNVSSVPNYQHGY